MFQAKVGGKFAALCVLDGDIDTLANIIKDGLLSTAEEILRRQTLETENLPPAYDTHRKDREGMAIVDY